MANKKRKNNNYKRNVNKVAEEQLSKIQASKNKKLLKMSSALITTAIACLLAFVVLLVLKLCGVIDNGLVLLIPFGVLLLAFLTTLIVVGRSLINQGMIDVNAIKEEEHKMMNNKSKNYKKYTKSNTNKSKYNKYKNIK